MPPDSPLPPTFRNGLFKETLVAIIEATSAALVVTDLHGRIMLVNREAERLFGYSRHELIGQPVEILVPRHFRTRHAKRHEVFAAEGRSRALGASQNLVGLHKDGTEIPLEIGLTPLETQDGQFVLASAIDVRRIRQAEEQFRQLAEHVKEAFVIVDLPSGRPVYISPAFHDISGRTPDEVAANPELWFKSVHPEDQPQVSWQRQENLRGRATAGVFRVLRPDGSIRWARYRMFPISDPEGRVYRLVGLVEDITDQRTQEEQFRQAQKMEAIGQLAGGIAHDFNNLLTAILGYTELVLQTLGPEHASADDLKEIMKAAESAAALTHRILAFSRRQILQPRVLDLNHVLERMQSLLRRLIGEDVTLVFNKAASLRRIYADAGQLEQIVMNLAVNARDAMPHGGRLTIETANVDLDEDYVRHHPGASAGRQVMLAVSDTGLGMDDWTKQHLFEPFFTTKAPGKGTGLGLATVYGIVKQSGGSIWVYSEPGLGTTFKIYLPVASVAFDDDEVLHAPTASLTGTETVLVVEDQEEVRAVIAEALRRHGYKVLQTGDGREAVAVATAHAGPIHLLITDVVMPQTNGREVALAVQSHRPDIRVLYASGYTDEVIVRHGILESGLAFVQKPFTSRALVRKVREVLDATEPPGI